LAAAVFARGAEAREAGDLSYRIQLVRSPEVRVHVVLATTGTDSGATWFEVSREWGGVSTGGDDISGDAAWGPKDEPLKVEHPAPTRWRVRHAPRAALRSAYDIARNDHQSDAAPETNRRPIVNDRLFHTYGELGLVRPASGTGDAPRHVTIAWDGFDAA